MRKKPENPAQKEIDRKIRAEKKQIPAFLLALLLLCSSFCSAFAQETEPPAAPEGDNDGFLDSPGFSVTDDGYFESSGESSGVNLLTEASFPADDVPEEYLKKCSSQGRVEKVRYTTSDADNDTKAVMVYLPAGYDESDRQYNVMYLLHASSGSPKNYLNPEKATNFQCLLDHMIANGELEPLIVAAPTYYPSEGFTQFLPLTM